MRGIFRWKSTRKPKQRESTSRLQQTGTKALYSVFLFIYFFFLIQMTSFMLKLILYCEFCWMTIHFLCSTSLAGVIPYSPCNLNTRFNWSLHILFLQCIFAHAWNTIFLKKKLKTSKNMLAHFQLASIYAHTHTYPNTGRSKDLFISFCMTDWTYQWLDLSMGFSHYSHCTHTHTHTQTHCVCLIDEHFLWVIPYCSSFLTYSY